MNTGKLKKIQKIEDPVEKLLNFIALLNEELKKFDSAVRPIVVGGSAVLVYSLGGHLTQDIDLVVADNHRQLVKDVLTKMGFQHTKGQRHWYHTALDLALEMPSDELAGSWEKVTTVEIGDSEIYLIGVEDILVDRLCSAKHWKYDRDEAQAISLLSIYGERLDWDYLEKRAREELVYDKLEELKTRVQIIREYSDK